MQFMLKPPSSEPLYGLAEEEQIMDFSEMDIRLPMLVYVSREKRPGYDHNKKAGAMNALVRASAVMSNGPFILNLDCDHYIYNSLAVREGMYFMMDRGGEDICYIQFPQRFEGIDHSNRYANHNIVFFHDNMRALDGLQGRRWRWKIPVPLIWRIYLRNLFSPISFYVRVGRWNGLNFSS